MTDTRARFAFMLAVTFAAIAISLGVVAVTHGALIGCYAIGLSCANLGFLAGLTLGQNT
jgi:energy-converting hydrogenase Eha subunit A